MHTRLIRQSVRFDEETAREVERFADGRDFSQVVHEAIALWLQARRRRRHRDELVRQSGRARSEAEQQEMAEIAEQAGRSALDLLDE